MCRGFAILANFEEVKYIENNSIHSNIVSNPDNYIKLEITMDTTIKKGYRVKIDEMDEYIEEYWTKKQFLLNGELNPKINKIVKDWCKNNELVIFKSFCFGCQDNSIIKGNNNQDRSMIKGDNIQDNSIIKGDNIQYRSIIKGNNRQDNSIIKGEFYIGMLKLTKYKKLTDLIKKASEELHPSYPSILTLNELIEYVKKVNK